ncbi:MAG: hypothetical protein KDA49_12045 [Rhodospirillaceae bacterium]|nr:hypothetical protein [Rhodospirillaceae bacterium]MCA8933195.1 hypothetical protein [Rhodospirillaceae bacterium]
MTEDSAAPALSAYARLVRIGRRWAAITALGVGSTAALVMDRTSGAHLLGMFRWYLPTCACIGAALAAPWLWGAIVPRRGRFPIGRGVLAGLATALMGHVAIGLGTFVAYAAAFDRPPLHQAGTSVTMLDALGYGVVSLGASVLLTGMTTLPLGAVCGALVTQYCRHQLQERDRT